MRNPIQPSPNRPVPLPDCILMDAWWTDRRDAPRERPEVVVRRVGGARDDAAYGRRTAVERAG